METQGIGVMGATDWIGLGPLIITPISGISHGIIPSGPMVVGLFPLQRPGAETHLKPRYYP